MAGRNVKRSRSRRPRPDPPRVEQSRPADPTADVPEPPGIEVGDEFFKALADVAEQLGAARIDLMQIHGMARCLADVLTYADDDDSPMHADVALVIARLLDEVVTNLELTKNQIPTNRELARSIMGDADTDVSV